MNACLCVIYILYAFRSYTHRKLYTVPFTSIKLFGWYPRTLIFDVQELVFTEKLRTYSMQANECAVTRVINTLDIASKEPQTCWSSEFSNSQLLNFDYYIIKVHRRSCHCSMSLGQWCFLVLIIKRKSAHLRDTDSLVENLPCVWLCWTTCTTVSTYVPVHTYFNHVGVHVRPRL